MGKGIAGNIENLFMRSELKAAVLKNDMEIVVEDAPTPEPVEDQVLVRVNWSSICGTDLHIYRGEFKDRVAYPRILGHEFSGVIESTGAGVGGIQPGDRVTVDPIIWCNRSTGPFIYWSKNRINT